MLDPSEHLFVGGLAAEMLQSEFHIHIDQLTINE